MYTKGDFHIHTRFSDGQHSPKEIVEIAKKQGVDIIAISDHNNTDGIDEAIVMGNFLNVKIIPAVELSTRYNNTRVHILGYFKDDSYKNELLIKVLKHVRNKNIREVEKIFKPSFSNSFRDSKLDVETGIEILHFFGATVVLAHPVLLPQSCLEKILDMNFDGIEAKYFLNSEEDTAKFLKIAKEKKLVYTAGSDFHGLVEMYRVHGMIGSVALNEVEIINLLNRIGL